MAIFFWASMQVGCLRTGSNQRRFGFQGAGACPRNYPWTTSIAGALEPFALALRAEVSSTFVQKPALTGGLFLSGQPFAFAASS